MRLHASAVAIEDRGVLIRGASGSGKSTLALQLMAMGAILVSDDQVDLSRKADRIWADAPDAIRGMVEARGMGLLNAYAKRAEIVCVVDLDHAETERLPAFRTTDILGCMLPMLQKVESPAWPAAILQYLKGDRHTPHG